MVCIATEFQDAGLNYFAVSRPYVIGTGDSGQ